MAIYMWDVTHLQAMMCSSQNDDPDLDIQGWIQKAEQCCPALATLSECRQVQRLRETDQPVKLSRKP